MASTPRDPPTFAVTSEVQTAACRAADKGLCPECFGRLFGRLGHGLSNPERAARLWEALGSTPPSRSGPCSLCGGQFDRWDTWISRCQRAAEGFEWHRFTCGSRWEPEILAREEAIWHEVGTAWGESARGAFNRELGKRLEAASGATGGTQGAEIVFLADLAVGRAEVTVLSLYVKGRYRKFDRTLPQTKWPCRHCDGRGCDRCGMTGKTYPTSVEELIAGPALEASHAEGSRFHGMGREDIDARMLGRGRPFVLELLHPRIRTIDLTQIAAEVRSRHGAQVEVDELTFTDGQEVVRIKEAAPEKSYRVGVIGRAPLEKVNEALEFVHGRAIAQRTPTRVAHRRSDRIRTRRIVAGSVVEVGEGRFTLDLRTEAGTYVKEWVEGDGGRTAPSLAELVGEPLTVDFLDVLEIHDSEGS
ncbi:MAG: tRNA pseudouridine(54/55) synthase Pus10 [Thermoplasmata archaeon]